MDERLSEEFFVVFEMPVKRFWKILLVEDRFYRADRHACTAIDTFLGLDV
jgi:hypothetical protein